MATSILTDYYIVQTGARLAGQTALKALLREMAKNSERDRP
jgi:hypothetical protein